MYFLCTVYTSQMCLLLWRAVVIDYYCNKWCVCPSWSLTKIKSSTLKRFFLCDNIESLTTVRGGKVFFLHKAFLGVVCTPPCPCPSTVHDVCPLECFSKDTLWKIKKPAPSRNRGIPRENISRRRESTNKSRGSPLTLKVWHKCLNYSKCLALKVAR